MFSNPPSPYHGSDLKNVNTFFFFSFFFPGMLSKPFLEITFNVMKTREHVN